MMKSFKFIGLLLGVLSIFGCQTNSHKSKSNQLISNTNTPLTIHFARDFHKVKEFRLSEIADDIEYVKLETTPESLVGGGNPAWLITKEFIFVHSKNRLLQFSRDGKYLKQIGRYGKGPGEFLGLGCMSVDEQKNILYVRANFKDEVLKYDVVTGEYLGNFAINSDLGTVLLKRGFQLIGADTFAVISNPSTQFTTNYKLLALLDGNGQVVSSIKSNLYSKENRTKRVESTFNQIWSFQDKWNVFESYNDTIYCLNNNELKPAFIFNMGKYKGPLDVMTTTLLNQIRNYVSFASFWETSEYLFVYFFYNGHKIHLGRIDKNDGSFCRLVEPSGNTDEMFNDIDGGLSFSPWYSVNQTDDVWVKWFDAVSFKEALTNEYLNHSEARFNEKKVFLKKFVDGVSNDDNPILMVVKLRQ